MVYECDRCGEQLYPTTRFCHHCGRKFSRSVPDDATPPVGHAGDVPASVRGKSPAARATIVLAPRRFSPALPPSVKTLLQALRHGLRR